MFAGRGRFTRAEDIQVSSKADRRLATLTRNSTYRPPDNISEAGLTVGQVDRSLSGRGAAIYDMGEIS